MSLLPKHKITQFNESEIKEKGRGFYHKNREYIHHTDLPHHESAFYRFSNNQKIILVSVLILLVVSFIINWHVALVVLIAGMTLMYFIDMIFNFSMIYRTFEKSPEIKITEHEIKSITDWPTYTIFCPLYKEWNVVPQFTKAMSALDYPKDRLQVMLLLEEDDKQTIAEVTRMELPPYFTTLVVPHSVPKTKPKALNYGLMHATGDYVVIYDAEDIPEPMQLKKVVAGFSKMHESVVCIQAKLNFYNPHQNILTRVFTAEYALWFDLVLTGLQTIHAPIPLGGTSNHFKKKDVIDLKGWDSFNVTEDADLGMRLVKKGFRTAIIDSDTREEANSDMKNWFWQRTRWIKGYIQTYFVHMRSPRDLYMGIKQPHIFTFQLIIGGKIASMIINPFMWVITISYFVFRPIVGPTIESFYPAPVLYMGIFSLIFGNFLYMYYYMVGCSKRGYYDLVKYAFLVPVYWLAMSVAAWTAVYLFIKKPHHWSKTKHGLHLDSKKQKTFSGQANAAVKGV